jgi:8-amino-3,8-dideoxy-alpha-D-manno-octulosonate transaminase
MPGYEIIDNKEKKALESLFKEGGILFAHGFDKLRKKFHVREFEQNSAKKFKSNYVLAVSSGTAAIKIALKALGVKPGDEVITQAFNFIATVEAILDLNAKPIIIGVNKSLNMDPEELEKKITKKTKVVIPVHMLGFPCEMNKIKKICKKNKIKILEDACEAIGSTYKGKYLGTLSEVGIFSLDFGKIITTGEGGLILSDSKKIYNYCKEYHDHGHQNNPKFSRGEDTKKIYGFNYRMTEMQGTIGKVQLTKLNYLVKDCKKKYQVLEKIISKKFEIRHLPSGGTPNYDTFIFFVKNLKEKKKVLSAMAKNNIGTKNLPDAIKWHCSYYWSHALGKKQIINSLKTKEILKKSIAIPVNFKINLQRYIKLAEEITLLKY